MSQLDGWSPDPAQRVAYRLAADVGVPAPGPEPSEMPSQVPGPQPGETADGEPALTPSPTADEDGPDDDGADAAGPAGKGLCQAYRSGPTQDSHAQRALASAAGGPDRVGGYCDAVLGAGQAEHQAKPTETERAHPSGASSHRFAHRGNGRSHRTPGLDRSGHGGSGSHSSGDGGSGNDHAAGKGGGRSGGDDPSDD